MPLVSTAICVGCDPARAYVSAPSVGMLSKVAVPLSKPLEQKMVSVVYWAQYDGSKPASATVMRRSWMRVAVRLPCAVVQRVRFRRVTPSPDTGGSMYVTLVKDPTAIRVLLHCPAAACWATAVDMVVIINPVIRRRHRGGREPSIVAACGCACTQYSHA